MATNKNTTALRNSRLLAGVQKRFPTLNMAEFPIGGTMYPLAKIVGLMQPVIDAANIATAARAAWQAAVQGERAASTLAKQFFSALRQTIYVLFGNQPDALADFGLLPRKARKPRTGAARVVAAAKTAATKKARNPIPKKVQKVTHGSVGATIEVSAQGMPAIIEPAPVNPAPATSTNGSGPTPPAAATPSNGNGAVPPAVGGTAATHG